MLENLFMSMTENLREFLSNADSLDFYIYSILVFLFLYLIIQVVDCFVNYIRLPFDEEPIKKANAEKQGGKNE